ncbi:MAG: TaqI family restriction endonuclease [Candidatus Bathyarchaeia archaeon]
MFWGCTDEFVRIGFRARLYRTWTSLLTQFHFMYLWNSLFDEKVEANADLNMRGIDRRVCVKDNIFNLQVKKLATGKRLEEEYLKVK